MLPKPSLLFASLALTAALAAPRSAHAAEGADSPSFFAPAAAADSFPKTALQVGLGPTGGASTWRGDVAAGGAFRAGLLLFGVVSPDFVTRLAYSTVDDRMLTYLSVGATGYLPLKPIRPYLRLAFAHQHEESRAAIDDDTGSALVGVGPGIRHRGGVAAALGAEAPIAKRGRSFFTVGGDVTATHFPDPRGPTTYVGGTLWASLHHAL